MREEGYDGIERLLDEMIATQRERVVEVARRIAPSLGPDDLLQPHDHPALAASADFNFEDGVLAGYLAFRAALRAIRQM
ncbi:MAG: hypothetical protein M3542_01310 [Acidobacteriota bacterium]|nr:hypothetical protein [Acidobacteriota bacterium]MDQ5871847.1 hypothetical protein [Acidobacteriota bacterium]